MTTHNHPSTSSDYLQSLGQRIAKVASLVGGKRRLAEHAGISESHLYRCIRGTSATTIEPLLSIAKTANISLDWLLTGEGDMRLSGTSTSEPHLITVPPLLLKGDATKEALVLSDWWLSQNCLPDTGLKYCISDSICMSPTITIGSVLFIDTQDQQLTEGAIYAFRHQGSLMIRRLQWTGADSIWLLADNPAFQATLMDTLHLQKSEVLGRLVSSFQHL
jgi:DNA-binding phage protein